MKIKTLKILSAIALSVVFNIFALYKINALAGDGWIEGSSCNPANNCISFRDSESIIYDPWKDDKYGANFLIDENLDKYCVNRDFVSQLVDYQVNKGDGYGYCEVNQENGMSYVGQVTEDLFFKNMRCCPSSKPKMVVNYMQSTEGGTTFGYGCCITDETDGGEIHSGFGYTYTTYKCADGSETEKALYSKTAKLGSLIENPAGEGLAAVFPDAEPSYTCPPSACFLQGNSEAPSNVKRTNLNLSQAGNFSCYASIGLLDKAPADKIIGNNQVCFEGALIGVKEYEEWGSLLGLYGSCYDSLDPVDRQRCIDCYTPCKGYDSCPLIYNSLGCVDTNPQGLITRVFQIGIGIVGAVGMVRVMQAAFMRQSGDPAKIKESYDIISSVVIGAILLIFGVVILRFVGVNVLQILPFDFLQ